MRFQKRVLKRPVLGASLTVDDLDDAERAIIQCVQYQAFEKEIKALNCTPKSSVPKCSHLRKLNPVLFKGILRVGGRIDLAPLPFEARHPVILPSQSHVTK